MKTLSELEAERAETARIRRASEQTERMLKLAEITTQNTAVFNPKTTADKSNYGEARERTRQAVRDGRGRWFGAACDNCKTELWCDGDLLLSIPSKTTVRCAGCGWIGYAVR